MKLFSGVKNFVVMICLGILILAALLFLARPLIGSCLFAYKTNKDKKAEIASSDQNTQNLKAMESKMAEINYTISKAEEFIPSEDKTNDFIVQLEATAKKSEVTISGVSFEKQQQQSSQSGSEENTSQNQPTSASQSSTQSSKIINVSGANEKAIKVEAQGSYPNIVSFLYNLHRLARFNIVKNLSLDASSTEGASVTCSFFAIIFSKS